MYHIVHDKRAQTSAECVAEGLFVCLQRQSFGEISVSDICRASGVSRATFYRLFDTPTDVLRWCCDRTAQGLDAHLAQRLSAGKPIVFRDAMQYMFEHSRAIAAAVECHRTDLMHDALYANMHVLKSVLLQAHGSQTFSETDMQYLTNMLLGMVTSLLSQAKTILNDPALRAEWQQRFAAYTARANRYPSSCPKPCTTLRGYIISTLTRESQSSHS